MTPKKESLLDKELKKLGTPANLKDRLYQKALLTYLRKNKEWQHSDTIVFKFWVYVAPTWIGYLIFAAVFGFLFIKMHDKYGMARMLSFIAVLVLWRINILITLVREANRLKAKN